MNNWLNQSVRMKQFTRYRGF